MEMELVLETSSDLHILTWLSARENLIELSYVHHCQQLLAELLRSYYRLKYNLMLHAISRVSKLSPWLNHSFPGQFRLNLRWHTCRKKSIVFKMKENTLCSNGNSGFRMKA